MAPVTSAQPGDGFTARTDPREGNGASLGELLKRARERRGLTLEEIAHETRIPKRHLEALERDNLTALPAGFYRRAEIRAYARAVGLDQTLALAQLESALKPVDAREPQGPQQSTGRRPYLLIALGVVAVAAVILGRAISEPTPALERDAEIPSATDALSNPVLPVRDASSEAVITQQERPAPDARPSPLSEKTTAVSIDPASETTVPDASQRATTPATEDRASTDSVTELVVTTQPAGARVTVNGIGWGISPVTVRHLPPGDKRIRVSKEGYATEERTLRLVEGRRRALDIRLANAP